MYKFRILNLTITFIIVFNLKCNIVFFLKKYLHGVEAINRSNIRKYIAVFCITMISLFLTRNLYFNLSLNQWLLVQEWKDKINYDIHKIIYWIRIAIIQQWSYRLIIIFCIFLWVYLNKGYYSSYLDRIWKYTKKIDFIIQTTSLLK